MMWLIQRLLIIWLLFCVVCAAAIALGRLDHTPTTLQTLGFDKCDGDLCFRGLKPGMDWAKAQPLLTEGKWTGSRLDLIVNSNGINQIQIAPSSDDKFIDRIGFYSGSFNDPLPFTVGNIVAQYGPPCRISLDYSDRGAVMYLIYPMLEIRADLIVNNVYQAARLQVNSTSVAFTITTNSDTHITCSTPQIISGIGPWHGFTSMEIYYERSLRDMGVTIENP
jgi:hypothetical protein